MVLNESAIDVVDVSAGIIGQVGQIALWLQGLGLVIVAYIVFQVINYTYNRRRMKEIYQIKDDMKRIESKIDTILKFKKR